MTTQAPEAPPEQSPWRLAGLEQRSRRRRLLLAELVVFVLITVLVGFPTGREVITFWMLLTLLAACAGDLAVWRRAVVRDWLPLISVLFLYDLLRGIANEVGGAVFGLPTWRTETGTARANLEAPLDGDKLLFGGTVPTTYLQERFYDAGDAHWYDAIGAVVYLSHFLVSLGIAITLWCVAYPLFRRYLTALVGLTLAALATYVLYPAVPPWMASLNPTADPDDALGQTYLPFVHRVVKGTLEALGSQTISSAVERGAAYSNPVAAMPSLHAAIPMMLLLFFWGLARIRGRILLVTYALTMALTLVYAGEHYVTDILAGWLYAALLVVGLKRYWRRKDAEAAPA